jgi:hypothetical protein
MTEEISPDWRKVAGILELANAKLSALNAMPQSDLGDEQHSEDVYRALDIISDLAAGVVVLPAQTMAELKIKARVAREFMAPAHTHIEADLAHSLIADVLRLQSSGSTRLPTCVPNMSSNTAG